MAKTTNVTLICEEHNLKQDFEISHSENLLRMKFNGGWKLPENSNFEFDLTNGIRIKQNTRNNKGKSKKAGNK